jgi:hypothetical protein
LKEELELVDETIAAPNRPFVTSWYGLPDEKAPYKKGAGALPLKN